MSEGQNRVVFVHLYLQSWAVKRQDPGNIWAAKVFRDIQTQQFLVVFTEKNITQSELLHERDTNVGAALQQNLSKMDYMTYTKAKVTYSPQLSNLKLTA